MTKEEICSILDKVPTPIYQIEVDLGMPKTTLQKAVKGERELPKKWALKLLTGNMQELMIVFLIWLLFVWN